MLLPLLSLIAALPRPCAALLEQWWSQLSPTQLQQLIAVVQQFLTVRLYHTQVGGDVEEIQGRCMEDIGEI